MLIQEDCVPCILKMAIGGLKSAGIDEKLIKAIFHEIVKRIMTQDDIWNITSAELVERVLRLLHKLTGENDLFRGIKASSNAQLLEVYGEIRLKVSLSPDPILSALKLSIIGNTVDTMISRDPGDNISRLISRMDTLEIDGKSYNRLIDKINSSRNLLYVGDNSAEAVLDRLFIEVLKERFNIEVSYLVRSEPALNDVTLGDAREIGLDLVSNIISNGIEGPLPGTIIRRCSHDVRALFETSDLILIKGGGNLETLSEEGPMPRAFFLLMCKCPVHERFLSAPTGSAVLMGPGLYKDSPSPPKAP